MIFALNVPLGALALVLGLRYLPEIKATGAKLDYLSARWQPPPSVRSSTHSTESRGACRRPKPRYRRDRTTGDGFFIRRQLRLEHPMLAVDLFRVPIFSVSVLASTQRIPLKG